MDAASGLNTALLGESDLLFPILSDSHIFTPTPSPVYAQYDRNTEMALGQMASLRPSFALHLGDVLNSSPASASYVEELGRAASLLRSFPFPIHVAPGNHDVGNKASIIPPPFLQALPNVSSYFVQPANLRSFRAAFGPDFYTFRSGNTQVLVLNSQLFGTGLPDEADQWDLIERTLAEVHADDNVVAAMHVPAYWGELLDVDWGNYEVIDGVSRQRLLNLLEGTSAASVALITGHTHFPVLNAYGKVLLITAPSVAFQRRFGFYDGETSYRSIDEARLGYLLARVRSGRLVVTREPVHPRLPPVPQLTGAKDEVSQRPVPLSAAEIDDNLFLVQATLPMVARQPWAPEGAIDGAVPGAAASGAAWSSAPRLGPVGEEWLEVQFRTAQEIDQVTLTPRPLTPTESGGFPEDFSVEVLGEDGARHTVALFQGFPEPRGSSPQRVSFPRERALGFRIKATKLRQANVLGANFAYCAQLSEVAASSLGGPNVASAAAGATVRASSCGFGAPTRRNDLDWLAALESGAKWVRLTPSVRSLPEAAGEAWPADALFEDALATAAHGGVRRVVVLSTGAAPASGGYPEYCELMAQRYGTRVEGWQLGATAAELASLPGGALAAAAARLRTLAPAATVFVPGELPALAALADPAVQALVDVVSLSVPVAGGALPSEVLASYEEGLRTATDAVRGSGFSGRLAAENVTDHLAVLGAEEDQAVLLARLLLLHQEQGILTTLQASGHDAALVDSVGNPRYPHYVLRAVASVLSDTEVSASPTVVETPEVHVRTFSRSGGGTVVAFWTDEAAPRRVSLRLEDPALLRAQAHVVDPVGFAIAPLTVGTNGEVRAIATWHPRFLLVQP